VQNSRPQSPSFLLPYFILVIPCYLPAPEGAWKMKTKKRCRKKKCKHCDKWFQPDHRTRKRQKFCKTTDCQKARKRLTAWKWRQDELNQSDEHDVARVRVWRACHPGYWRKHHRRCLIIEFLVPVLRLKKSRFWAKLTAPKAGALRILNLAGHWGQALT